MGRLANMQELVGKLGGGDLVGKNFGGGDLVGNKNLNNIVGNLWKQQEEGSGSSHGNMVSSNQDSFFDIHMNIKTAKVPKNLVLGKDWQTVQMLII